MSREFRTYRERLRQELTSIGRLIYVQEDFIAGGGTLLAKLDDYISRSHGILHLIGEDSGHCPTNLEVQALLDRYPEALETFLTSMDAERAYFDYSYTQWEAYLACFHNVPCYLFLAETGSEREPGWTAISEQSLSQRAHMLRLYRLGRDRTHCRFDDPRAIALQFLKGLSEEAPWAARQPHNLPPLPVGMISRSDYVTAVVRELGARRASHADETAIVCLAGLPGSGKTTIAVEVAMNLVESSPGGEIYINLHGFSDNDEPVTAEIALDHLLRQAGFDGGAIPFALGEKARLWRAFLSDFSGVVILDNARNSEHVLPLLSWEATATILVTSRSPLPELRNVSRIAVEPFLYPEAQSFFRSFFPFEGQSPAEQDALVFCVDACGRLPLFLGVLGSIWGSRASSFAEVRRHLEDDDGTEWAFRSSDTDGERVFWVSFNALSADAQALLTVAALLPGPHFTEERLTHALGRQRLPATALFELLDYKVVQRQSTNIFKVHDLVRRFTARRDQLQSPPRTKTVMMASLDYYDLFISGLASGYSKSVGLRSELRQRLSNELDSLVATAEASIAEAPDKAFALCGSASASLSHLGLNTAAYSLALIGLRAADQSSDVDAAREAHRRAAKALMHTGEFVTAESHFDKAIDLTVDALVKAQLLAEKAFCLERRGRYEEGLALLDAAVRAAPEPSPALRVEIGNTKGAIYWRMGRYHDALRTFCSLLNIAGTKRPRLLNNIGFTYFRLGKFREAKGHLLQSYRLDSRSQDLNSMTVSLTNLGYAFGAGSAPERGASFAGKAYCMAVASENRFQQARAMDAMGDCYRGMGRTAEAREMWRLAIDRLHDDAPERLEIAFKRDALE